MRLRPVVNFGFGPIFLALFVLADIATAEAQSLADELRPLDSRLTASTLADLPLGGNVYSALETMQAEVIADRFSSGGLNVGEPARVGGFLGSWSQTLFRVGDIDITDPASSGAPLFFPELLFWDQIDVANGLMTSDINTPALGVTLTPRRPGSRWTGSVQAFGSGGRLAAPDKMHAVPPIVQLEDWGHGSAIVTGPISGERLGIAAGASWTRGSTISRSRPGALDSTLGSGLVNLIYRPSATTESQTLVWVQRSDHPYEYAHLFSPANSGLSTRDSSTHVQSTWQRDAAANRQLRVFGGLSVRARTTPLTSTGSLVVDRLYEGPISAIAASTGHGTTGIWTVGAGVRPVSRDSARHQTEFGANVNGAFVKWSDQFVGSIFEMVDNLPARQWTFTNPQLDSRRHVTSFGGFLSDRMVLSPEATLDASIRLESVQGAATGAAATIGWVSLLPRAVFRWQFAEGSRVALIAGYRRSANRLNLDLLSIGDPAGEVATVRRWLAPTPSGAPTAGPLVDRVGPGTGGNPDFSKIDPGLKRPTTDEFVAGIESRRRDGLRFGLIGVARRETNLIGVIDVGVPIASYSTIGIPDPGHDFASTEDDQVLTVYNRLPSTFGRNQYVLTNPGQQAAAAYGLKFFAERAADRLFFLFGATASAGIGAAGHRGYLPIENDQDVAGELFTNPNAATFARGRLFGDRAFTIKWTTAYRFPWDVRVGAIARYQDGQPFARLVFAPDLNQGAELVRAYANGGNRFTFTGTLDIRVQKGFRVGQSRADAIVDFYNLATRSNEVEEYTVTGASFRTPTAIEPPRSVHLGVRITF